MLENPNYGRALNTIPSKWEMSANVMVRILMGEIQRDVSWIELERICDCIRKVRQIQENHEKEMKHLFQDEAGQAIQRTKGTGNE